jgi:cytochrome c oxidase subunit 2
MNRVFGRIFGVAALVLVFGHAALAQTPPAADPTAAADSYVNAPHDWQMWFPVAGSPMQ